MRGKLFGLLLVGTLSVLLAACGKKDEPLITPIEAPASPYQEEVHSDVQIEVQSEVQEQSLEPTSEAGEESDTCKFATTADEWTDDLMSDDMHDFMVGLKEIHALGIISGSDTGNYINLMSGDICTANPDEITLSELNTFLTYMDLFGGFGEEFGREGKIKWESPNEFANLLGFESSDVLEELRLGDVDSFSSLDNSDSITENYGYTGFLDRSDVITGESSSYEVPGAVAEKDMETGKVWLGMDDVYAYCHSGNIYFIGVDGWYKYLGSGSDMKICCASDTPDGTVRGLLLVDWKRVFDEVEEKGRISASSSDCILVKDIPFFVISESELENMDLEADLGNLISELESGVGQNFSWSEYFVLEDFDSSEIGATGENLKGFDELFKEYFGVSF